MTAQAEFTPLRPRRLVQPLPPATEDGAADAGPDVVCSDCTDIAVSTPNAQGQPDVSESHEPARDVVPTDEAGENAPIEAAQSNRPQSAEVPAVIHDIHESSAEDAHARAAELRNEATRFAAMACARALRTALAEDPETIARFVDDAMRACGRFAQVSVRLNPEDAAAFHPRRDLDVTADAMLERGQVVVETDGGSVAATLDERAMLLARAVADA